jgi:hypothetical protein
MTLLIVFSNLLFNGFLVTNSNPRKTNLPPSSAGIGIKLSSPILILKKAVNARIEIKP